MRLFLSLFDDKGKDGAIVGETDPLLVSRGREAVGDRARPRGFPGYRDVSDHRPG
ncbi:MAG: hypothetical protein QM779_02455 [Propionicimonas sp.]|uniref:hypothetical protein n=1 Tax=Propionicimonas sp. TaxID=1955623 RepID=UPI003D101C0C